MTRLVTMAVPVILLLAGCAEVPEISPPLTGRVMPMFDPSADPAVLPTPTNLAMDRATGLLTGVPKAEGKAQEALHAYLRTLDGYPVSGTAEVKFDGKLKRDSLKDAVLIWDITAKKQLDPTKDGLVVEYLEPDNDQDGAKSMIRIFNPAGWKRANEYAFFALSSKAKGLKDSKGQPLIRSALFELAFAAEPLCAWDQTKTWAATDKACKATPTGKTALGCCTHNYSALVESTVAKQIYASAAEGTPEEEIEGKVKEAVLESASQFEAIRRDFDRLVKEAGLEKSRDEVVVVWSFTTVSMNEAIFNPAASPPELPTPTDLVRDPTTGFLDIPTAANASAAEQEFNKYLSTLDGWHLSSAPSLDFTEKLDDKSVSSGSGSSTTYPMKLFKIDVSSGTPKLTEVTGVKVAADTALTNLTLTRKGGLERGTKYLVLALAGTGGLKNKVTTKTGAPIRSALMHLTLLSDPLCTWDDTLKACKDTKVSSFIDDPKGLTGGRSGIQKATIFETIRRGNDALLKALTAAGAVKREDVISAWTFTTTTMTELVYDVTAGVIPFPNAVLVNQTTGKLDLPEGSLDAALLKQLNQLDGFSTQGPAYVPYYGELDATTVKYGTEALVLDLEKGLPANTNFKVDEKAKVITATPPTPLTEGTQKGIAIVLVSKLGAPKTLKATAGLTDKKGNRLIASSFMALKRSANPLYDSKTGKSLVSSLDDATAALAEQARAGHKQLFDALKSLGIEREDIVAAWTYKTQSITKRLKDVRTKSLAQLPAAPKLTGTFDSTLTGLTLPDTSGLGGWVPNGTFKTWLAINESTNLFWGDPTKGKAVDVKYMLTVPKTGAGANGWPVAIYNHGLSAEKETFFGIANAMGKAGIAVIAFDTIYHGERSWCTKNEHCEGSGTCATATGTCSNNKLADADKDGIYDASGVHFLNTANPFAIRDNMQQHAVDVSALVKAIAAGGAASITGGTVKLDKAKINVIGRAIGGNLAVVAMAAEPQIQRGVFSGAGAPLVDVLLTSADTAQLKKDVLDQFKIKENTVDFYQLVHIFHTILDPGDAGPWATKLDSSDVIVQLGGADKSVPTTLGKHLASVIGITDTTDTTYAGQGNYFLIKPDPTKTATAAAQLQAGKFLLSGTICKPNVTTGTCP